jgi:leucyl aminopeptidase
MTDPVKIQIARAPAARDPVIVVGCLEGAPLTALDAESEPGRAAARASARSGWRAACDQRSEADLGAAGAGVLVLHGLGSADRFDTGALDRWVRRIGIEVRARGASRAVVVLPEHDLLSTEAGAEGLLRALALVDYRFDEFRRPDATRTRIRALKVVPPESARPVYRRAHKVAEATGSGVMLATDLANTPPNVATPAWMAERARELAREFDMKATVLGPAGLGRRGMGGILAVGGGSRNTPRLVRLEWGTGKHTVALVGKGVTFDTGGISIKPAAAMDEMKYDKSGACTVLGIARAVAELGLRLRLRVYIPLAENMPDGASYRPGDIVTCYNGKTVEIRNTDAEGRMILADALTWAAREKPDYLLDYATLTGACVVALGSNGAGLFSPSDPLAESLLAAADESGEYLWRLPLWPEFTREMHGVHADLKNSGSRWAGACTAAAFLAEFIEDTEQWAHLDIAGPAYVGNGQPGRKGATGYGVSLTVRWLRSLGR